MPLSDTPPARPTSSMAQPDTNWLLLIRERLRRRPSTLPWPRFNKPKIVCFAVETYGGMGKGARKLVRKIASVAQDRLQGGSEKEIRRELEESVAIAVQRGNADIMLAEYFSATSAAARGNRGSAASAA